MWPLSSIFHNEKSLMAVNLWIRIITWCLNQLRVRNPAIVCRRSFDPFYIVTYYLKWVKTSWTDGTILTKWQAAKQILGRHHVLPLTLTEGRNIMEDHPGFTPGRRHIWSSKCTVGGNSVSLAGYSTMLSVYLSTCSVVYLLMIYIISILCLASLAVQVPLPN